MKLNYLSKYEINQVKILEEKNIALLPVSPNEGSRPTFSDDDRCALRYRFGGEDWNKIIVIISGHAEPRNAEAMMEGIRRALQKNEKLKSKDNRFIVINSRVK